MKSIEGESNMRCRKTSPEYDLIRFQRKALEINLAL